MAIWRKKLHVPSTTSRDEEHGTADGRSLRRTGRIVQLNLKVSPETKLRLTAIAARQGLRMTEVLDLALRALEDLEDASAEIVDPTEDDPGDSE
jgi:hypothetical protein